MINYLITGATGYIGSMLIKYLLSDSCDENIRITAIVREIDKAQALFGYEDSLKIDYICADIVNNAMMDKVEGCYDYIIHCASVTKSLEMITHPISVIEGIVNGTQNIMKLALRCRVKSVVYLSSMEIYGQIACSNNDRITEEEIGVLDNLNVRNCYPISKRMAENICFCYQKEHGVPVKIARLAQVFGEGIIKGENRVFAQFALAAYKKQDIVLHTSGSSVGNYCDIHDAVRAIMTILKDGVNGEAYNVVNEANTMTIYEMAELVAKEIAHGEIKVKVQIPNQNIYGYASDTKLRLSAQKLIGLQWQPRRGLVDMYKDVISSFKEQG